MSDPKTKTSGMAGPGRPSAGAVLAKLRREAIEASGPTMVVAPTRGSRVTGWVVVCPEHGARRVALGDVDDAVVAAGVHLRDHHHGAGKVERRDRPGSKKRPGPRRG